MGKKVGNKEWVGEGAEVGWEVVGATSPLTNALRAAPMIQKSEDDAVTSAQGSSRMLRICELRAGGRGGNHGAEGGV